MHKLRKADADVTAGELVISITYLLAQQLVVLVLEVITTLYIPCPKISDTLKEGSHWWFGQPSEWPPSHLL